MEVEYTYWIFILALHGNHWLIPFGRWSKWFTVSNSSSCFFFAGSHGLTSPPRSLSLSTFKIQKRIVQFTCNKNLEVLIWFFYWFPIYDDHSYMIFPIWWRYFHHWEKSQASEEEQEKAKQLIKAALDMIFVGHFWKTYIFFQPNKVFQEKHPKKHESWVL